MGAALALATGAGRAVASAVSTSSKFARASGPVGFVAAVGVGLLADKAFNVLAGIQTLLEQLTSAQDKCKQLVCPPKK